MKEHMSCYGRLFPSALQRESGETRPGVVFAYRFHPPGTVALPPEVTVDIAAWDRCLGCQDFSGCVQLSTAKLTLEMALRH
jgi:hypothetical protein